MSCVQHPRLCKDSRAMALALQTHGRMVCQCETCPLALTNMSCSRMPLLNGDEQVIQVDTKLLRRTSAAGLLLGGQLSAATVHDLLSGMWLGFWDAVEVRGAGDEQLCAALECLASARGYTT